MSGDDQRAYEAARVGAALFDVSRRGKIEAAGKDAVVFLHNLSTNDVKNLAPLSGRELFFCNATASDDTSTPRCFAASRYPRRSFALSCEGLSVVGLKTAGDSTPAKIISGSDLRSTLISFN